MSQPPLKLDGYLPYRLSVTANGVSELIARAYRDRFDLSIPQWRLIAVLGEGGPLTPQDLCARTVMDKVTVSRAAAALCQRHLAQRAPNAADGRSHRLSLTAQGEALFAQIAPLAQALEARLLAAFTADDIQTIHHLLRRLGAVAAELIAKGQGAASE